MVNKSTLHTLTIDLVTYVYISTNIESILKYSMLIVLATYIIPYA